MLDSYYKVKQFVIKHPRIILAVFLFIYIVLFIFLSLKKYYGFSYNANDLSIFNQVFFNSVNGRLFVSSINLELFIRAHFTPITI